MSPELQSKLDKYINPYNDQHRVHKHMKFDTDHPSNLLYFNDRREKETWKRLTNIILNNNKRFLDKFTKSIKGNSKLFEDIKQETRRKIQFTVKKAISKAKSFKIGSPSKFINLVKAATYDKSDPQENLEGISRLNTLLKKIDNQEISEEDSLSDEVLLSNSDVSPVSITKSRRGGGPKSEKSEAVSTKSIPNLLEKFSHHREPVEIQRGFLSKSIFRHLIKQTKQKIGKRNKKFVNSELKPSQMMLYAHK